MRKPKQKIKETSTVITIIALILFLPCTVMAGSLEPSAPPASTMKTLDEVEPRTPISSIPYSITQPGSYYLTGDLSTSSTTSHGIGISASNVTVDFMGYSLTGPGKSSGSIYDGIYSGLPISNVEIRNGTLREFGD
ncbi:MAG: hypothetical protein ACYTFM_11560, partial [Planctomycetota bacterium]